MICPAVQSLQVEVEATLEGGLKLRYELTGDLTQLRIPGPQIPSEEDGLWKNTCFELFVSVEGDARYHEFNFSPSGQWAAYAFSNYRERSEWVSSQAPDTSVSQANNGHFLLEAMITAADFPPNIAGKPLQLGLAAVIEAEDGQCSYWALLHPSAHPDFHHRDGFACILARRGDCSANFPDHRVLN